MNGFIYFPVPKKFHKFYPADGRTKNGDYSEPHITLLALGDFKKEKLPLVEQALKEFSKTCPILAVRFGDIGSFPEDADGWRAWFSHITGDLVQSTFDLIKKCFDGCGAPYSILHPDYIPHSTLIYSKEPAPELIAPKGSFKLEQVFLFVSKD